LSFFICHLPLEPNSAPEAAGCLRVFYEAARFADRDPNDKWPMTNDKWKIVPRFPTSPFSPLPLPSPARRCYGFRHAMTATVATDSKLNPPLKWAGGKRWLVPHVAPIWQKFAAQRYVEPFCGGLAMALGLQPQRARLNDANPHLINFYRQVQRGLTLQLEMRNDEELFYAHRDRFNQLIAAGGTGTPEAAQLFYYLNRTCFNGLCRFNKSGEYNVPFGTYQTINYATDFLEYRELLRRWTFSQLDLEELEIGPDDFIYADPP
jgi:DNA adenine methylase